MLIFLNRNTFRSIRWNVLWPIYSTSSFYQEKVTHYMLLFNYNSTDLSFCWMYSNFYIYKYQKCNSLDMLCKTLSKVIIEQLIWITWCMVQLFLLILFKMIWEWKSGILSNYISHSRRDTKKTFMSSNALRNT